MKAQFATSSGAALPSSKPQTPLERLGGIEADVEWWERDPVVKLGSYLVAQYVKAKDGE